MSEDILTATTSAVVAILVSGLISGIGWLVKRSEDADRDLRLASLERSTANADRLDSLRFESLFDAWRVAVTLRWSIYRLSGEEGVDSARKLAVQLEVIEVLLAENTRDAFNKVRGSLAHLARSREMLERTPSGSMSEQRRMINGQIEEELNDAFPKLSELVSNELKSFGKTPSSGA